MARPWRKYSVTGALLCGGIRVAAGFHASVRQRGGLVYNPFP